MSPKRVVRKTRSGWRRAAIFLREHPLPAYILVFFATFYAIWELQNAIDDINQERAARVQVSVRLNRYICAENNKQDKILANLIGVSLAGQQRFGAGLDLSELSSFDRRVVAAIGDVQGITESSGTNNLRVIFERAQAKLLNRTPCNELVTAVKEAADTEDYEAVSALLREIDRKDRKAAHEAVNRQRP